MELPASYLETRTTFDEVLADHVFNGILAGSVWDDWERLTAKAHDGDELWHFEPPPGAIEVWGIALVRNGKVISTAITAVG